MTERLDMFGHTKRRFRATSHKLPVLRDFVSDRVQPILSAVSAGLLKVVWRPAKNGRELIVTTKSGAAQALVHENLHKDFVNYVDMAA